MPRPKLNLAKPFSIQISTESQVFLESEAIKLSIGHTVLARLWLERTIREEMRLAGYQPPASKTARPATKKKTAHA